MGAFAALRRWRRGVGGRERGMVTVEMAAASLVLAAVTLFCVAVFGAVFQLGLCQLTANEVARQQARGDAAAVARASADAPVGARVETRREGGATVVTVALDATVLRWRVPLAAQARVIDEVQA